METIDVAGGCHLAYEVVGDPAGVPVLFQHGTGDSRRCKHPDDSVTAALGIRLVTADRPAVGGSSPSKGRSILDWVPDVDALADALGIEQFVVAGHSGGGPHALAVAAKLGDRVTKVGFAAPPRLHRAHVARRRSLRRLRALGRVPRRPGVRSAASPSIVGTSMKMCRRTARLGEGLMRRRGVLGVLGAVVVLVSCVGSSAWAATSTSVIDDGDLTLVKADDGSHTLEITVTNLSDAPAAITATPAKTDRGCAIKPAPATVPANRRTKIKLTFPATCRVGDDGIDFDLTVGEATGAQVFELSAAAPKDTETDFSFFPTAYLIAAIGVAIAIVVVYLRSRKAFGDDGLYLTRALPGIEATWKFGDSWSSNVTVAGTALAGLFAASNILTPILGKSADQAVAVIAVASAAAVFLAGVAPLVLSATMSDYHASPSTPGGKSEAPRSSISVGGLVIAAAFTLVGTGSQLAVVAHEVDGLGIDVLSPLAIPVACALGALILVYAVRSLEARLKSGVVPPPPPKTEDSDTIKAAKLVAAAIKAGADPNLSFQTAFADLNDLDLSDVLYPAGGTSPGDEPQRYAALL